MIKNNIKELFFEVKNQQERLILGFLKDHQHDIYNYSLNDVAELCFCSPTSVTRVIKKLGFQGFLEYKNALRFQEQAIVHHSDIDVKLVVDFAKQLKQLDHIFVYGKGTSSLAAQYFFRRLVEKGYVVAWLNEQDLLYSLDKKNLMIISNTGETDSVIEIVRMLNATTRNKLFTITKKNSTLDKLCLHGLYHSDDLEQVVRDSQNQVLKIIDALILEM